MTKHRANVTVNVFAEKTSIHVINENEDTKIAVSLDVSPIKVFVGDASGDYVTLAQVLKLLNESYGVTTVYNALRLGGFPADHYPRKAEHASITGRWRHIGNTAFGGNFDATAPIHNIGISLLKGDILVGGDIVSEGGAISGFSGHGLWYSKSDSHLMVDNLTVRKALRVYELIGNQIRGTNGSLWVSDTVKVFSVEETDTTYRCFIDTSDGDAIVPFMPGDLVRSQKWTGKDVRYYSSKVINTTTDFFELDKGTWDGWDSPEKDDVIVRFGNVSDTDRQGALYLTSSDTDAPYMDVIDGVDSFSLVGKTKVRLGKLDGIYYNSQQQTGYGLFAERALLTGAIRNLNGQWALNEDGSGTLAGGVISWTKEGAFTFGNRGLTDYATIETVSDAILNYNDSTINPLVGELAAVGNQVVTINGTLTGVINEQGQLSSAFGVLNGRVVELDGIVDGHNAAILTINGQINTIDSSLGTVNGQINQINDNIGTLNVDFNSLSIGVAEDINSLNSNLLVKINEMGNQKNTRYISASEPTPPEGGFRIGDEWMQETQLIPDGEGEPSYTYESFMWFGNSWEPNITMIDGARITTGVIDAQRIVAKELFAQEIGAVNLHVAQGFVGGFTINNVLSSELPSGAGITIDPTNRSIIIKDLAEGQGISQVIMRSGPLTPEALLRSAGGTTFHSSTNSNQLNIRKSGNLITSNDLRAANGVTVKQYIGLIGSTSELMATAPSTRFTLQTGKNYASDLPYLFSIHHSGATRNGRLHKIHGDLTISVTSKLIGYTSGGASRILVGESTMTSLISRSDQELIFNRALTRKVSFYSEDCVSACWEVDIKMEGNLTYQQWTSSATGRYWMTTESMGIDFRGSILQGLSFNPSAGIVEITTSGFQAMWANDRFFRIDGNNTDHFIESNGKWVHNGTFQLNGADIVTLNNISSAIASDLSAYATKNFVETGFYNKTQSDGRYSLKGGASTQDFTVKDLIIHGTVNHWLADTITVDDANLQLNRQQGGATVASGLIIFNKDTQQAVTGLQYGTNNLWAIDSRRIATMVDAPANNGIAVWDNANNRFSTPHLVSDFPRKAENAVISGAWNFATRIRINNQNQWFGDGTMFSVGSTNNVGIRNDLGGIYFGNDTPAMSILLNKNVGIGTTSPQVRLQVNGNVRIIGGRLQMDSDNTYIYGGGHAGLYASGEQYFRAEGTNNLFRIYKNTIVEGNIITHGRLQMSSDGNTYIYGGGHAGLYASGEQYFRAEGTNNLFRIYKNTIAEGNLSSNTFISGFAGSGWRLDATGNHLTVDNLTVRKQLKVYELLVEQLRAQRGSIVVSPGAAKIESATASRAFVDTDNGRLPISIVVGDKVRCQRFTGNGTKYIVANVTAIGSNYFDYTVIDGTGPLAAGDEVAVFGSDVSTRQGIIYITSSDDGAPYMDVLDGVNSASLSGKTRLRIGKLSGISGQSGYGIWGSRDGVNEAFAISSNGYARIAGWSFTNNQLVSPTVNGGFIQMSVDGYPHIQVYRNEDNFVNIYHYTSSHWGIRGRKDGAWVFRLGSVNEIAGWSFTNNQLVSPTVDGGFIQMSVDGHPRIQIYRDDNNRVNFYHLSSSDWGIGGMKDGAWVFRLGGINQIAGCSFDSGSIWSGTAGSEKWKLNADGSGQLASGKISWTSAGAMTIQSSLITSVINTTYIEGLSLNFVRGTIGGFTIANNRIGVEGLEDYSGLAIYNNFIKFSNSHCFAAVGTNVLATYVGVVCTARFENNYSAYAGVNIGVLSIVTNATRNIAFKGTGDIVTSGFVHSYRHQTITPASGVVQIPSLVANTYVAYFQYNNSGVSIPTKSEIQAALNINTSTPFSIRITIIIGSSAYSGTIWGRNSTISGMNTDNYAYIISNAGAVTTTGITATYGDVFEFQLVYDTIDFVAYRVNTHT